MDTIEVTNGEFGIGAIAHDLVNTGQSMLQNQVAEPNIASPDRPPI